MIKFTKMHGLGNDYVYIDCINQDIYNEQNLAKFISNRNFGVGSDGLILIKESNVADFRMQMFNSDGIVVTAKALNTSYGNYIIILHDNGLYTLYAHGQAGSIAVSQYERVKQGQQIMRVGSTGNSTGPHLHFEVRTGNGSYNNRVDPRRYLP